MNDRDNGPLAFLSTRRSVPVRMLRAPAPEGAALDAILAAGMRVPDHGKLEPWRLIVLGPQTRARLRAPLAAAAAAEAAGRDAEAVQKVVAQLDSPLIVAVVSAPREGAGVPEWEQVMSAGNVALSLVNAALASGWGAAWLSGPMAEDAGFGRTHLGLGAGERIVALVHLGSVEAAPPERPRPDPEAKVTRLP